MYLWKKKWLVYYGDNVLQTRNFPHGNAPHGLHFMCLWWITMAGFEKAAESAGQLEQKRTSRSASHNSPPWLRSLQAFHSGRKRERVYRMALAQFSDTALFEYFCGQDAFT